MFLSTRHPIKTFGLFGTLRTSNLNSSEECMDVIVITKKSQWTPVIHPETNTDVMEGSREECDKQKFNLLYIWATRITPIPPIIVSETTFLSTIPVNNQLLSTRINLYSESIYPITLTLLPIDWKWHCILLTIAQRSWYRLHNIFDYIII